MKDYYKYLPVSKDDERWGLTVLNAGCTHIEPAKQYPYKDHPEHHNFNWKLGRVLQEFQVIYIANGEGVFESERTKQVRVKAGSVILLFPNERHRYKPDGNTGWDEYWIGINGSFVDNLYLTGYLKPDNACIKIGFDSEVINLFNEIIENTRLERPGYQPLISGAAIHLIGMVHAKTKQSESANLENEHIIIKAQLLFRANINNIYSPEQAAQELNVGYSWFRKHFKSHTGLSPGQYYVQLKIEHAKTLLANQHSLIKEIAFQLRFESAFYFSKVFREKTGLKPTEYRKINQFSAK
jgi:AraC-like DNA-binding protein